MSKRQLLKGHIRLTEAENQTTNQDEKVTERHKEIETGTETETKADTRGTERKIDTEAARHLGREGYRQIEMEEWCRVMHIDKNQRQRPTNDKDA